MKAAAKSNHSKTKVGEFFRDLSVKVPGQTMDNSSAISPSKLRNATNSSSPVSMQKIKIKQKITADNDKRMSRITPIHNM